MRFFELTTAIVIAAVDTIQPLHPGNKHEIAAIAYRQRDLATECMLRVARHEMKLAGADLAEVITEKAVPECTAVIRTMIGTYDEAFGTGVGERFFMGPFLDQIPTHLQERLNEIPGH